MTIYFLFRHSLYHHALHTRYRIIVCAVLTSSMYEASLRTARIRRCNHFRVLDRRLIACHFYFWIGSRIEFRFYDTTSPYFRPRKWYASSTRTRAMFTWTHTYVHTVCIKFIHLYAIKVRPSFVPVNLFNLFIAQVMIATLQCARTPQASFITKCSLLDALIRT